MEEFQLKYLFSNEFWPTVQAQIFTSSPGLIGIFGVIYLIVKYRRNQLDIRFDRDNADFQAAFCVFWGLCWTGFNTLILLAYLIPYHNLQQAYDKQDYRVSEGVVQVLYEQPASGHAPGDKIRIGTTNLTINYYFSTPGYQLTLAKGGVLKQGAYVRVYDHNGVILRIDLKESQPKEIEKAKTPTKLSPFLPIDRFR